MGLFQCDTQQIILISTILEAKLTNMRSWQQSDLVQVIVNRPVQLRIRQKQMIREPEKKDAIVWVLSLNMLKNVQTTCFIPSTINGISVRKGIAVVWARMKQNSFQNKATNFSTAGCRKEPSHSVLLLRCGGLCMWRTKAFIAFCAKDMTHLIPKTSLKFLTRNPENDFALY